MKKMNQCLVRVLIVLSVMSLSGCANRESADKYTDKTLEKAHSIYDTNTIKAPKSLVTNTNQLFLSDNHFVITPKEKLPPVFDQRLVYSTGMNESLAQTFANISKLSHVPVVFADDAHTKTASQEKNTAGVTPYQGTLKQVVSQLTNRYGLFWTYKKGRINIFLLETKVYALDAPIGSFNADNTISSDSDTSDSSGGSSGGSSQATVSGTSNMNLKYTTKADSPWSAALTTIKDMLSPAGKIQGNPVEGYIAVTDNPDVQEKVADYIEKINAKTNKKIAVRIDVYDVETSATSDLGVNIDSVASVLSSDQAAVVTNSTSLLNQELSGDMSSITVSSSDNHGVILKALNTLGKTTEVTGATIYTVSGQPAPIQSVKQQTYLASMSTTTTTDAGTTTSLTPGTTVTGYSMMVTPKIEANNQIMMSLNLQLSTLLDLTPLCSDAACTTQIQGPSIASKNFLENMVLHSGQSLLIAGFQDETADSKTSSPGSTDFWLLGGGKTTQKAKVTTVVVVTPYIIGD